MDFASLLDVCFALGGLLGTALLLYGAWLCLPFSAPKLTQDGRDESQGAAVQRRRAHNPPAIWRIR
jgi:hypothetical protein